MKQRKILCICIAMMLTVCMFAGCSQQNTEDNAVKQTASAKQITDSEQTAVMTADLTGGYSVEFASGAAYFYKGEASDENNLVAFAYVIDKKEYDEEIAYLTDENNDLEGEVNDLGNGAYSYNGQYFFPTDDGFYIKVAVQENAISEADSIYPRFSAHKAE